MKRISSTFTPSIRVEPAPGRFVDKGFKEILLTTGVVPLPPVYPRISKTMKIAYDGLCQSTWKYGVTVGTA